MRSDVVLLALALTLLWLLLFGWALTWTSSTLGFLMALLAWLVPPVLALAGLFLVSRNHLLNAQLAQKDSRIVALERSLSGGGPVRAAKPPTQQAQAARALPASLPPPRSEPVPQALPGQAEMSFVEPEPQLESFADLVVALNFPSSQGDHAGLQLLKRALRHPVTGPLVLACQDILTLLGQDAIYMDDLKPHDSEIGLWRMFARGRRGPAFIGLAAIDEPDLVAHIAQRLHHDTIFRDASHHFLRKFDRFLAAAEPEAEDAELRALLDTRSARAFMLIGKAASVFGTPA